jgi:hypothetical protein
MSDAIESVRQIIRSSDELKTVLEATLISGDSEPAPSEAAESKRILAVVAHKDDWDLIEEGW